MPPSFRKDCAGEHVYVQFAIILYTLNRDMKESSKQSDIEAECFEDLLKTVGHNGRRNITILICATLGALTSPLVSFTYAFLGATPDHWCSVDGFANTTWSLEEIKEISVPYSLKNGQKIYSKCEMYDLEYDALADFSFEEAKAAISKLGNLQITSCSKRNFALDYETTTTKWDLVCESRIVYASIQGAVHAGYLMSSLIFGYFLDKYGRIVIFRSCVILHIILGIAAAFSPLVEIFILLKFLHSLTAMGFYMAGFVIVVEFTTCQQRALVSSFYAIPFSFGIMLASAIAYVVRPWNYLQLALVLPNIFPLLSCWILPESPRWLIIKGRQKEAYKIMKQIATSNGKVIEHATFYSSMEKLRISANCVTEKNAGTICERVKLFGRTMLTLFLRRKLAYRTMVVFFCWFSVSMIYYSISLGSPVISTNKYLFIFIGGAIEVPAYMLLWPTTTYMGRRATLVSLFAMCTLAITTTLAIAASASNDDFSALKTIFFLIGKFGVTAAFHLMWMYTAELYPTNYRSLAVGQGSTMARVGSICSPYISDILGAAAPWAPSTLFSAVSFVAGGLALLLPETKKAVLMDGPSSEDLKSHNSGNAAA